jgi:CIC family chloride channel protein
VGGAVNELDTSLFTVVGAAAFLGAGYRVPLAAVVFVAEATGRPGFVVPGLLAAVAAELVMGRYSVTAYQRANGT